MKSRSIVSAIMITLLLFTINPTPSRSAEEPVLEILQVEGISEEIGSFRFIDAPYFTDRNYYKQGMAFDQEGNLYVTDSGEGQIEVFDKNLQPIRHFGSLGNGDGQFQYLADIKIDNNEIFTLDILLHRIQVFDLSGHFLYSFETGLNSEKSVSYPLGFAISLHEKIFVIDVQYGIKIFDRKGKFIRAIDSELGFGEDGLGRELLMLEDMKTDESGNVYCLINFSGDGSPLILVLDPEGSYLSDDIFETAIVVSQYLTPNGCFAFEGDNFYALLWNSWEGVDLDKGNLLGCFRMKYQIDSTVKVDYETIEDIFDPTNFSFAINNPTSFLVRDEVLYILDSFQNKIIRMNIQGELIDIYESPSVINENWQGIYGDNQGSIYIANATKGCIEIRNEKLEVVSTIGKPCKLGLLPDLGELYCPYGMVIDSKGYLYCSDYVNECIQIFGPDQQPFMTFYPLEHLETPAGLYFDKAGNLVLLDKNAYSIYLFDISQVERKEIKLIKTIEWQMDYKREVHSLAITEKNNYLIPIRDGESILAEMDDNGKIKKRWADQLKTKKKEPVLLPRAVWQDDQQNYLLLDEWRGYVWKFNQGLKVDWIDNLNWFGIREVWESKEGKLYALDQAHHAILVFRDTTFDITPSVMLDLEPIPETTYEENITIKGSTDMGSTVRIGEDTVFIDGDGQFEKVLPLQIGENKWMIEVTHPAKKTVTREISIYRKEKVIIRMQVNSTIVLVNSIKKELEASPFLNSKVNRVFAPIRVVVEAIEGTVEWVAPEQKATIHKGSMELVLIVNNPYALLNGKKILIDPVNEYEKVNPVVPTIVSGRVFLPLRFIGENLGFLVEWEEKTQEIVLTYPDPNRSAINHFSVNAIEQSFGKVISYSLSDQACFISPLQSGEVIALVPSAFNYTGIVKMDGYGKMLDSHFIDTTGKILPLSNHGFLLVSSPGWQTNKRDNITFTWLDEEGKLIKSKVLTFEFKEFYISEIQSIREIANLGFEMVILAYSRAENDVFDGDQKIRVAFDSEGNVIETTLLQIPDYSNYKIGQSGILVISGYEAVRTFTLHDKQGKSLWSKKIKILSPDNTEVYQIINFEWLSDNTILMYSINQKTLCMARLDGNGTVFWNTTLSMKDDSQIVNLSNPVLSSKGGILFALQVKSTKQNSFSTRIVALDQSGKVTSSLQLKYAQHFYLGSLVGTEEDFWITGSTQRYAFGSSSAIVFHYQAVENNPCFIPENDIHNNKELITIESNTKAENFEIQNIPLPATLDDSERIQQPVRFLTKDLCP